jgi:UDP-GlcNAc:undecaprenyl-phosphate GlcNAc-1-phosphate transferase
MIVLPVFAAFLATFAVVCLLLTRAGRRFALDTPNERSLHETPVPRTGGLAIMGGIAASLAFADVAYRAPVLIALGLALVSFVDDLRSLPTGLRFAAHLLAAAVAVSVMRVSPEPLLFAALLLGLAWLTNLYNFMDGSDGLAGGMAAIGFGACALAAYVAGVPGLAGVCAAVSAAAVAFLLFNFHPAKIFMGDSGSIPLGFLAGVLGLAGWRDGAWPWWFPLLVFGPFVADATFTLLRRIARRERLSQAHRSHYYQRLVRMGLGHRRTALLEYVAMAACAALAIYARTAEPVLQAAVVGGAFVLCVALAAWIDRLWALRGERGT